MTIAFSRSIVIFFVIFPEEEEFKELYDLGDAEWPLLKGQPQKRCNMEEDFISGGSF